MSTVVVGGDVDEVRLRPGNIELLLKKNVLTDCQVVVSRLGKSEKH